MHVQHDVTAIKLPNEGIIASANASRSFQSSNALSIVGLTNGVISYSCSSRPLIDQRHVAISRCPPTPFKKGTMSLSLFDPILGILKATYYAIDEG